MVWTIDGPQGNESAKIKWELVPYTRGKGLDLGCGPFKTFPHFTGVDNGHHDANFGWRNKADLIVDTCEDLSLFADRSMDFVFSSHLLEHIHNAKGALKEWWRVIKPGGHLCLYLPHKELYPNVGEPGANPDHKHDFMPQDIIDFMSENGGWDLVRNEDRNEDYEYSFFQVYKKLNGNKKRFSYKEPKPKKTCAVVRYGAFGDLIQASSVFPGLKKQGFHITLYTTPNGYEVVKHDPHIDKFIIQDRDQVPNHELGDFWESEKTKYDRFINLSESVEGTLLAIPGRMNHTWPDEVRRKEMGKNYNEWLHTLAGVPMPTKQKFYPTTTEREWAAKERAKMGKDSKIILWCLAGSSVHKSWPHLDTVVARLLLHDPKIKIVFVGDMACKILETGWEDEPRIIRKSGEWSIRETLSLLEHCDLIIGPETGVLNAAGLLDVPKVIMMSHSSVTNLTRDWVNVSPLVANVPCYPCHRMHYDFSHCHEHKETGTSMCQYEINADQAWLAILYWVSKWQQAAA